jgi:hypothetical protein
MVDIDSLLSQIGLPAGAIALAVGLVRGAKALETDANPEALKYVSALLTEGHLTNLGKAGAGLVPYVFDKLFGSRPLSIRFIARSIVATTLFWALLLTLRHASWTQIITVHSISSMAFRLYLVMLPPWYILDWLSLSKSRFFLKIISPKYPIMSSFFFLVVDIVFSYTLAFVFNVVGAILDFVVYFHSLHEVPVLAILNSYLSINPLFLYFSGPAPVSVFDVMVPSTMLTSVWTFFLFVSCLIAQVLAPIDYLRRFTVFWFRNVERHPLTAIAKVAATLIVVGAMAIKAVRWI